jgi:hypothetical protein
VYMINKIIFLIILGIYCITPVFSADRETGKFYVTAKQGLNIRPEPGKGSIVIVKMPHGAQIEILEYSKEEEEIDGNKAPWAKVKYKKYTGWAFSLYLSKEQPK